jgi:hypothetical protein
MPQELALRSSHLWQVWNWSVIGGVVPNRPLASKDARLPVCALIQHPQLNQNKVLGNRRGEAEACGGNGGLAIANRIYR